MAEQSDSSARPTEGEEETEEEKIVTESSTEEPKAADQKRKIDIFLKPAGNTPIMKKKKWSVEPDKKISMITNFIHRYLKLEPTEQLFIYINQAFAPAPDQIIENLYECFETDGKLVLHYCINQAWG